MKQHPSLSCLLLSLLYHTCSDRLIENLPSLPCLFYDSNIFTIVNGYIKVDEFQFNEVLKANDEHLSLSEPFNQQDFLGEYRLEENSIKWTIMFQELEKQNFNTKELKGKMIELIERNIEYLVLDQIYREIGNKPRTKILGLTKRFSNKMANSAKGFIDKTAKIDLNELKTNIKELVKPLIKQVAEISTAGSERSEYIAEIIKRLENDFIVKIEKLIEESNKLLTKQKKQKIKMNFIRRLNEIKESEESDSGKRKSFIKHLLEYFIEGIDITKIKELEKNFIKLAEDCIEYIKPKIKKIKIDE